MNYDLLINELEDMVTNTRQTLIGYTVTIQGPGRHGIVELRFTATAGDGVVMPGEIVLGSVHLASTNAGSVAWEPIPDNPSGATQRLVGTRTYIAAG
jgi:hypothetical protein